jgi:hypothetical protein
MKDFENDHSQMDQEFWTLLNGGPASDLHEEEYWAVHDATTKWLVYYLASEDYIFMPVAIVEAQDADEAIQRTLAAGISIPEEFMHFREESIGFQASRFTLDLEVWVGVREKAIECCDCGQAVKSANGALCPRCLDSFIGSRLDRVTMIPRY